MKETPLQRLAPLAELILEELLPYLNVPFAFLGHSMGALLSFELARLLRKRYALSPSCLVLSSHVAAHIPSPTQPLHLLSDPDLIEELRRLKGTPPEILANRELLQLKLPVLRADFAVCETYEFRPAEPLSCPFIVCGGEYDPDVTRSHLDAWRRHTTAECSVHMFQGDHFYLHSEQMRLLNMLNEELTKIYPLAKLVYN